MCRVQHACAATATNSNRPLLSFCGLFFRLVVLQCIPLQVDGAYFYAKVGCMERETFTSTKLQLHVYTDQQCSQQYNDGQSARKHATRGYDFGNYYIPSKVSFKPEFYSCLTCSPDQISQTFNKVNSNWYDDDRISVYGKQNSKSSSYSNGNGRQLLTVAAAAAPEEQLQVSLIVRYAAVCKRPLGTRWLVLIAHMNLSHCAISRRTRLRYTMGDGWLQPQGRCCRYVIEFKWKG